MHRFAPVALATILAATAPALLCAQAPTPFAVPQPTGHFTDPANLAGERVRPRNGPSGIPDLPIDGGLSANGKPDNALALAQQLRRLNTRASLMLIVAHPDDEDGGMLTYYSRGLGARVAILTLNRGEGGQNQATSDFDDALGLLRTQELLAADRYMGIETQMFGTEVDFGFTKTKAEAFQKWNHQRVLYDAVRAVRIFRPLIIASTFEGAVTDGHGQHQVSGEIAQEVFKAAGDPNVFPELTREGILPWQPLKVFARVPFSRVSAQGLYDYATGQTVPAEFTNYVTGRKFTTEPTADVTINEGQTDPLLSTCAANPSDLPRSFSLLSSPEGGSASPSTNSSDCQPLSYVQFARIGLGLQRSQIGGGMRMPRPGRSDVSYHLYGNVLCNSSLPPGNEKNKCVTRAELRVTDTTEKLHIPTGPNFFDGIDTSIRGIADVAPDASTDLVRGLDILMALTDKAIEAPDQPERVAPLLADVLTGTDRLIQQVQKSNLPALQKEKVLHELRIKRVQANDALALALGLYVDATAHSQAMTVRSTEPVHVTLSKSTTIKLGSPGFFIEGADGAGIGNGPRRVSAAVAGARPYLPDYPIEESINATDKLTSRVTKPYFFRSSIENPVYQLSDPELRNAPQTPPALTASANVPYGGTWITVARVVHSGSQPVQIIPPVSLTLDRNAQVIPDGTPSLDVNVHVATEDHPEGELRLLGHAIWSLGGISSPRRPLRAGTETFPISLPPHLPGTPSTLNATAIISGATYTEGFRAIGYGTLPHTNFYTPSTLRVVPVDLKLPPENKRRIAYLPGTGDDVPAALASIGLTPTILKVSDLTADKLKAFDTVILGVRTYNAHPDLHGAPTQALFDFARSGGNVVVQYQTPEFGATDAPYPLTDSNERVIDETAPVKLLDPSSPLLTTPNKITPADFNNWIEERGHGFLDTWDSHYTALTETGDPGAPAEHIRPQEPQRGGLITVQLGKGRWTYVAFALYRQLPEAVPGAFRLFVNLLNP